MPPATPSPQGLSFFARSHKASPPSPLNAGVGQILGDFRLLRLLGQGAMGQVWEALQQSLDRPVALKLVRPERISEKTLALFAREARAGGRLQHANLVSVHAHGTDAGSAWIAMELVEGARTLRDFLDETLRAVELPEGYHRDVARFVAEVADGMHAAHAAGVIHRDLKPQNILIAQDSSPKVSDFGLAKLIDEVAISDTGDFAGTYWYASPEQVAGRRMGLDHRTDIFSLGVVLYELLAQRRPFEGDSTQQVVEQILTVDPPDLHALRSRTPRDMAVITAKCLEKSPARRYRTMEDLSQDLRRFLRDEAILARPTGRLVKLGVWARRNPTKTAAGGVAAVSFAAITGLLLEILRTNEALVASNSKLGQANVSLEVQTQRAVDEAARAAQAAEAERASRASTSMKAAELAVTYGRWDEALEHYAAAEASQYTDAVAIALGRFEAYESLARPADALRVRQWLLDQEDLGRYRARAQLLLAVRTLNEDLPRGIEAVRQVLATAAPAELGSADRLYAESLVSEDLGAAIENLRAARRSAPRHLPSLSLLGPLLIFAGQAREALDLAYEFELLYPNASEPRLVAALAYGCLGRSEEGRDALTALRGETSRGFRQLLLKGLAMLELVELSLDDIVRSQSVIATAAFFHGTGNWRPLVLAPPTPFLEQNRRSPLRAARLLREIKGIGETFTQNALGAHRIPEQEGRLVLQMHPWIQRNYRFDSVSAILGNSMQFMNPIQMASLLDSATTDLPEALLWLNTNLMTSDPVQSWNELRAENLARYRGVTANLPSMSRIVHLLRISQGMALLRMASPPPNIDRAAVRETFTADLHSAGHLQGISEEEFLAYTFFAVNDDHQDKWIHVERLSDRWRDSYGETLVWYLTRAEIALARGSAAEGRDLIERASALGQEHPWLTSLRQRAGT